METHQFSTYYIESSFLFWVVFFATFSIRILFVPYVVHSVLVSVNGRLLTSRTGRLFLSLSLGSVLLCMAFRVFKFLRHQFCFFFSGSSARFPAMKDTSLTSLKKERKKRELCCCVVSVVKGCLGSGAL